MPMGAACYAAVILVIERAGRMFWALAQRQKDIDKWRKEGREEGWEEGREDERTRIERELVEQGIEVPPEAIQIIRSSLAGSGQGRDTQG